MVGHGANAFCKIIIDNESPKWAERSMIVELRLTAGIAARAQSLSRGGRSKRLALTRLNPFIFRREFELYLNWEKGQGNVRSRSSASIGQHDTFI